MSLFDEVRSLLQRPPSTQIWTQLCMLCDDRDALWLEERVVPYIQAHVARWPATIDRPVQWMIDERGNSTHWLADLANCIDRHQHGLTPEQHQMFGRRGLRITNSVPLRPTDRSLMLSWLLSAPDVELDVAMDPNDCSFEEMDFAYEQLCDSYPALGRVYDPTAHRTLTWENCEDAIADAVYIQSLAVRCGFTNTEANQLAFGRVRIIEFSRSSIMSLPSKLGAFYNVRMLDLSHNKLMEFETSMGLFTRSLVLNVSHNPMNETGLRRALHPNMSVVFIGNTRMTRRHQARLHESYPYVHFSMNDG